MTVALVCELARKVVRFGLVDAEGTAPPYAAETLDVLQFPTFTDAVISYLRKTGQTGNVRHFGLAVAGVAGSRTIGATNGRWQLSVSGLGNFLGVEPIVMNDFAASAHALKSLPASAFRPIAEKGASRPAADASFILIGPLDGLGVAGLLSQPHGDCAVQSEAGHTAMVPVNVQAQTFLAALQAQHRMVYTEHLLSEDGLRRAHSFFAKHGSVELSPLAATKIVAQARFDPSCQAAVDLFVAQLAAFSRDMILALGAWRGLYLSGPIANALFDRLSDPAFRIQIAESHRYARMLRDVPIAVVVEQQTVLPGLAAAVRQSRALRA